MRIGNFNLTIQTAHPALLRVQGPLFGLETRITIEELDSLVRELTSEAIRWRARLLPDYYAVLGVDHTATDATIKTAYRQRSKVHHPDTGSSDDTRMQQINEAYAVLGDPQRRQRYDATL